MITYWFLYIFGTLLAIFLGFVIKLFVRVDNKFKDISTKIPGPPGAPIVGNTFEFMLTSEQLLPKFDEWVQKYGHRLIYRVGTYWIVILSNPTDIEKLLTSTTETVKSEDYEQLIPWLGTGLLISNGEKWSKRRKLLTPAFHFKILEKFLDVFNQQSFKFVEIIKRKYQPEEEFDVCPLITKLTLDIICETAMGVKINAQEQEEDSDYIAAISRIKLLQQHRAFRPWLESSLIWNLFSYGREEKRLLETLHQFTNNVIKQRKLELRESATTQEENDHNISNSPIKEGTKDDASYYNEKNRSAFLDLLLKALQVGDLKTDEDVREETDTFMFEGHDTVASGIAFTLFLIGNHPEVQQKVHEELQNIFQNDSSRPVTIQDLGRLKYLECCIKESLRICPSVPLIARSIQQNFELDNEIILPPGTLVLVLPYQLHRNTDVYTDPLCFRPERFFPEEAASRHAFAYVPFSAGPRNCIGQKFALMEEKVVIANVLRNFKIHSMQKLSDLIFLSDLILHSKHGIKIKYENIDL